MDINEIKEFLRLEQDYTEEDIFLDTLVVAAKEYIKNATSLDYDDSNELYKLAIKILVTHWYENREAASENKTEKIAFSLNSILAQLQYCYLEEEDGDTE